ncbi:MAG: hypothetical protein KAW87_00870 [Candidatus Cloacimonetes bacterium]|nr:hypothetical protein [Candidatus Cloacimonadota bacterium]
MSKQSKINLAIQEIKRREIKDDLRLSLEHSIDQRVNQYLEINHQWIIGNHGKRGQIFTFDITSFN